MRRFFKNGGELDVAAAAKLGKKQWEIISVQARKVGGAALAAVTEITPWVTEVLEKHEVFTILGI